MIKFSITSILVLTFWIAVTIASVTVINASGDERRFVIALITASFSLVTLGFAFYSLFSSIFGGKDAKPFWIGCAVTCWFLIGFEPFLNMGVTSLSNLSAHYLVADGSDIAADLGVGFLRGFDSNTAIAKLGIAVVLRHAWIPLLGVIGGVLANAISTETKRTLQADSDNSLDRQGTKMPLS